MKFSLILTVLSVAGLSAPAYAHHSFAAEYDGTKVVKLTGAITKVDWSNPHVYFYIDVEDAKGNVTSWSMEMGAPGALRGRGWDKNTLKVGEVVTVEGSRAKDGGNHANARSVTTSDGKQLGAASSQGQ
jgi:hypothetical protein